ncbi:MAG: hypothetical protein WC657_02430 [Candidatus Paceibacterota bacterium]|jgi:hypothetical protein
MKKENLTDIILRLEKLEKEVFGSQKKNETHSPIRPTTDQITFSINERAFVKRYASDKSGPKKFTLMVAYLAKGEVSKSVQLSEIKKHWDKMKTKALLGSFNMFYPNDAKTRGWIDSKEYGSYNLTNEWKEII